MTASSLALPSRYHGSELIATGGMADVYVATDEILGRRVAIKVLAERFARDPDLRARFTREARIAARLSNEPNVVTIFDVADVDGRPAIVMEYLTGGTVADRMRGGRVSPALALTWLADAGRALDAAHAHGVVHRDVKPANLMLAADGDVRVTDFGVARIAGDVSLTSAGTILGTSGYMSPEQAVGGKATAASDRYGLAVVAFELLAGRRPYVAETFASEAAAHATAPIPSATALDPTLPPAVDDVFARGLAKAPDDRFRSCGELVSSLRQAFADAAATTMRVLPPAAAAEAATPLPASPHLSAAPPARESAVSLHRGSRRRNMILLAALGVIALLGVLVAVLATRDEGGSVEAVTVVRTATVAGTPQVHTVTVESEQPTTSAATTAAATPPPSSSGASLNDQGFRLLQNGNAAGALPLLEQAVAKLDGTGSLTEAYASYNLAWALFATGSCDGVKELLERSKQIQGKRKEIDRLRHDVDKGCKRRD
jgi:eukaryotic-like serine/threonine-protein kinase